QKPTILTIPHPLQFQSQMRSTPMVQAEFSANAEKAARVKAKTPVIQGNSKWHSACSRSWRLRETNVTLRIEKDSDGQRTTIRLIGRMKRECIEELKGQIEAGGANVTLDLNEV